MTQHTALAHASEAWRKEVDAEAARLLNTGAARNPTEAARLAVRNVQEQRASANGGKPAPILAKVADVGGPLSGRVPGLDDGGPF
ncbi:hypothetical protein [Tardiphaga sp. 862_B3_N1_1]|uniref:hypothetical protein n=1 Tax=Tardiphaga sp. 862_B3_N1_1 TaxID=3240763 RepID=UPI003F8B506D